MNDSIEENTASFYAMMKMTPKIKIQCIDLEEDKINIELSCDLVTALAEYKLCHYNFKYYKERLDLARDTILSISNGQDIEFDGIKVSHYEERGRIDYSAIEELKNIDVEKYRKPGIKKSRISFIEE